MTTFTRKFSQFPNAGTLSPGQLPVGLVADGTTPTGFGNRQFNFSGSSGGVLNWLPAFGPTVIVPNTGYYAASIGTVSFQMPAIFPLNQTFRITSLFGSAWIINLYIPNAQYVTNGGPSNATISIESTGTADSVEILCIEANKGFLLLEGDGNPIFT